MNHKQLRTLLATIDGLEASLAALNEADGLLAHHEDHLPYGAVYNARKACIATLFRNTPSVTVGFFTVTEEFVTALETYDALGALFVTATSVDDLYDSYRGALRSSLEESDHPDTVAALRADLAELRAMHLTLNALTTIAAHP